MSKAKTNMTDNLLGEIMQAQQPDPEPVTPEPAKLNKAQRTASVYLSNDQHKKLAEIADELKTNKHAVMQLAIRQFIERWDQGERPIPKQKFVY